MIKGDSTEYDLLESACNLVPWPEILTAEIGVRQGQGSKIILDSFKEKNHWHIGIDPYGNLNYQHYDTTGSYTCDYTNSMKLQLLQDLPYENFTLYSIVEKAKEQGHKKVFVHLNGFARARFAVLSCLNKNDLKYELNIR